MGKAHNRNQQKINDSRVINITGAKGSPKNKPFIGVNVYTKEDDAIIERMLQDPTWSVSKIKNALPYKHTTKNIMNKLLQFCSQKEIDAHISDEQTASAPETAQTLPQMTNARVLTRWTADEIDILCKHVHEIPLSDPAWKTLIPNHSSSAIANKVWSLRNRMPKQQKSKRIYGWLASDIELLKLAMSEPDNKPLPELMQDIIDSLDEKHTAIEINKMVKLLGLTLPDEPVATHKGNNMTNTQKSCASPNSKLTLLSELCTLIEQFPENITYDIHVNFGSGIHFDISNPAKPKQNDSSIK